MQRIEIARRSRAIDPRGIELVQRRHPIVPCARYVREGVRDFKLRGPADGHKALPGQTQLAPCEARYLLLDEPTAALDIAHQHACLRLARQLAARGLGLLLVLHDINLAAHYADRVSLLHEGRLLASGTPDAVLRSGTLTAAFGAQLRFTRLEALGRLQLLAEYLPSPPVGSPSH